MATKAKVDNIEETKSVEEAITKVEPIRFSYKDNDAQYVLEFNRRTVRFAESKGFPLTPFNAESIVQDMPFTVLEDLFYYAFQMHHQGMSKTLTDKILYDDFGGLSNDMMAHLIALYLQTYTALINTEEGKTKNPNLILEL